MEMNYERWHDGVGFDLTAITGANHEERLEIEELLVSRSPLEWREIEAWNALATPRARERIADALRTGTVSQQLAILNYAPDAVDDEIRTSVLVHALEQTEFHGGLTQTLALVEEFQPAPVIEALFLGALGRTGDAAVHFAAMLAFVHGKAESSFDWALRPLFLKFGDAHTRDAAFDDLCALVGADASMWRALARQKGPTKRREYASSSPPPGEPSSLCED